MEMHWEMWGSPIGDMGIHRDTWNVRGHKDTLGRQRSTGGWGWRRTWGGSGRCKGSYRLWKNTGRIGRP